MEEKAERDFNSFVERTSHHKALKVLNTAANVMTFVIIVVMSFRKQSSIN